MAHLRSSSDHGPAGGHRGHEGGAASIEFAALFVLFFTVLYAVLAYTIPLLLMLSYNNLSAKALRAAVRIAPSEESYLDKVNTEVNRVIANSWLPLEWRGSGCPSPGGQWLSSEEGSYAHLSIEKSEVNIENRILLVCIERNYDRDNAIIPVITLGSISIPQLPDTLRGSATGVL